MDFFRSFREKQIIARQESIKKQSETTITVSDFGGELFIAYNGVPFVPIKDSWTSKDIVSELSLLRNNYIRARLKEEGIGQPT